MPVRLRFLLSSLAGVGVSACAAAPVVEEPVVSTFVKLPPKPWGCAYELFEDREPSRPYRVLGTLPLRTNEWLGARKRKALLRRTVCEAGADAVLLPRPEERVVGDMNVREYTAIFIAYTDVPARTEPDAAPPPLPPPSGEDYTVPISEEVMGDTEGTEVRQEATEPDWESP
ncbi:hypothetical protein [Pyxidicoccus trucidator]|uniref:hypothetical protein n=1 Tax=Pyxidicoccus trucidator TaxID=2709662 RepID=UPI0013DC21A1|nr:hypothetical protein [Pyxidicoccus trucidator]